MDNQYYKLYHGAVTNAISVEAAQCRSEEQEEHGRTPACVTKEVLTSYINGMPQVFIWNSFFF